MAINKVVYGSSTLIDLTADTAVASDVAQGKTFHLADGTQAVGSFSALTYKRWIYTNPSLVNPSSAQIITLLTDSWLAQNYNSEKLEVIVTAVSPPQADDTGNVYFCTTRARNVTFGAGKSYMQYITRVGGSAGSYTGGAATLQGTSPTTRGMLRLNSSGELTIRIDSNCQFAAGDYEIIARLIP